MLVDDKVASSLTKIVNSLKMSDKITPGRTMSKDSALDEKLVDILFKLHNAEKFPFVLNLVVHVVSFRLPLTVTRTEKGTFEYKKEKSPVISELHAIRNSFQVPLRFIGWPGIVPQNYKEQQEIEDLLEPHDCIPVFLKQSLLDRYLVYLTDFMIPLFHGVFVMYHEEISELPVKEWIVYQSVNRIFAETLVAQVQESDSIWVDGLHLLLLPQYISRRMHKANVGLYFSSPFPSFELFRSIPIREEILHGMLFADLIGFHFFKNARNFIIAVKRLLGIDLNFRIGGVLELHYNGKVIVLKISHAHIQYRNIREFIKQDPRIQQIADDIRKDYNKSFIFLSIDQCQQLSWILHKLKSFELYSTKYQITRPIVLLEIVEPQIYASEDRLRDYQEKIQKAVDAINSKQGISVVLQFQNLAKEEKYAYFLAADCYLHTSISSGLTLEPFEFICCKGETPTPLIISEFSGCSGILVTPIQVNLFRTEALINALNTSMMMTYDDFADRFQRDRMYLERNSMVQWAEEVLIDLQHARKNDAFIYVPYGFGKSYRLLGMDTNFQQLNIDQVVQAYRAAKHRIFFLDHEGTLAPDRRKITAVPGMELLTAVGSAPSPEIRECLTSLCQANDITVILSGRDQALLTSWFDDIPGLGLCAEHGFYYKVPALFGNHWKTLVTTTDFTWKVIASELMNQYVKRTQGAFIENKGSALVFQYRDADSEFGVWQAKELSNNLKDLLFGYPVIVVSGKGYVEVKLSGVSKGVAVDILLKALNEKCSIDFILCIGDDRSDEEMFPVVNSFFAADMSKSSRTSENLSLDRKLPFKWGTSWNEKVPGNLSSVDSKPRRVSSVIEQKRTFPSPNINLPMSFTVTIGKKPSNARFFLNDVEEVLELLQGLTCHKF